MRHVIDINMRPTPKQVTQMKTTIMNKLFNRILLGGALFSAASLVTLDALAGKKAQPFTPFERIAVIEVDEDNCVNIDPYICGQEIATKIATYIATVNDDGMEGMEGGNWILGGTEHGASPEEIEHAILRIPYVEETIGATKKVNVFDVCNPFYAKKALGVTPIVDDKYVVNGPAHAPALPCQMAVFSEGNNVVVDILNPEAIFTLFFSDVIISDEMEDDDFDAAIKAMTPQVKSELKAMAYNALDLAGVAYEAKSENIGPEYYGRKDIFDAVDDSPANSPYVHFTFTKQSNGTFSPQDVTDVAQVIINTMTIHGGTNPGVHTDEDLHCDEDGCLEDILSDGSSWRSARPTPLGLPGNNKVIEACSPKYAKQAMATGLHHATALPCEITVNKIEGDTKLMVSFLDPHFMFIALFKDAFDGMSEVELERYAALPPAVLDDLRKIVTWALENNLPEPLALNSEVQVEFKMLPGSYKDKKDK